MNVRDLVERAENGEALAAQVLDEKLLDEAPQDIPATDFGFADPETQKTFFDKIQKHHAHDTKVIDSYKGLEIKRAGNTIFAEDSAGLVYFVQFIDEKYRALPGRHVTQIAVWRRSRASYKGLASHTFWNHLFPIHGLIMSDGQQTDSGQRFWVDRISEAFELGHYVYRVNLLDRSSLTHYKPTDYTEFRHWIDGLYGSKARYRYERIVISATPLT
jgi:hypothetical protein